MKSRIFYIDNLRICLTFLVVAHHWAISNGAPGDTYYTETNLNLFETLLMSIFVATNQAFFMGFFFFISGYFVPSSYKKKGAYTFLKERLVRLGIPLVFYVLVISPLLIFASRKMNRTFTGGLWEFITTHGGHSLGPMWFVSLLLIFSFLYMLMDIMFMGKFSKQFGPIIIQFQIIGFLALIVLTFVIRIFYPVGDWLPVLGIQPAHLTQYVLCFALGIWAKENDMLQRLNFAVSKKWFVFAQILILVGLPLVFWLGVAIEDSTPFMGGRTWQSLAFVVWEQLVALSLILGLLGIFNRYFNTQNNWLKDLSENSYAVYVFHGVILTIFSAMFQFYHGNSFVKFVLLLAPVFLFSYLLSKLVRSIPIVRKVL